MVERDEAREDKGVSGRGKQLSSTRMSMGGFCEEGRAHKLPTSGSGSFFFPMISAYSTGRFVSKQTRADQEGGFVLSFERALKEK